MHKLRGEVARQQAIAAASRDGARRALAARDVGRSRALVARARTAIDRAREAEARHDELRELADDAIEGLRALGARVRDLEHDRLRALAAIEPAGEHEGLRRELDLLEAERELERELG